MLLAVGLIVGVFLLFAPRAGAASGAISTTDDLGFNFVQSTYTAQACLNGHGVNCNLYKDKRDVFLSGLPIQASLGTGDYFFAVLDPGGQSDPNDGGASNLSDTFSSPYASDHGTGDAWTNRVFHVDSQGNISYPAGGTHEFDSTNKLVNVSPYDDTRNPGGEYIMAVCRVPAGAGTTTGSGTPGVAPKSCKYDAFKVRAGSGGSFDDLTVMKSIYPAFTRTLNWDVAKSASKQEANTAAGDSAMFKYTVTATWSTPSDSDGSWEVTGGITVFNPNSTPIDGVTLTDTIVSDETQEPDPSSTCTIKDSSNNVVSAAIDIPASASSEFSYVCSYSAAPAAQFQDNIITATWDKTQYSGTTGSASEKVPFTWDDGSAANPTVADACATVTDTFDGGSADTLGDVCSDGVTTANLWSGLTTGSPTYNAGTHTWTFEYDRAVTAPSGTCHSHDNTADLTTDTNRLSDSTTTDNSQSITVCGGADLGVSKTASTAFTRTYKWAIEKKVDHNQINVSGGTAAAGYEVDVNQTDPVDSEWQVWGTITLTNPNDWEAITADVTDALDPGSNGSCAVTGGAGVEIPKSGHVDLDYKCTYSEAPSPGSGTNTGTATWDAGAYHTPHGATEGTASYAFGNPTTRINQTITPTDTFSGGSPVNLCTLQSGTPCTLTGTDSSPWTTQTYMFTKTVSVAGNTCTNYPNKAAIKETGQDSDVSTRVCGAVAGGLTMGFWQNKNGQGIITGGASTGSAKVCDSGTWLRQYAPFQDLGATANCSAVATYVYNIIKAANASGSSMNAMLKAQMLATALDVYFSDPALGGNRIGAPLPLGGIKVDLTKIPTGSGSYENVSDAFGGATGLTVSEMLSFENGVSNADGSTWYGQNKTTQGLAKDAFDAINNAVAFVAP